VDLDARTSTSRADADVEGNARLTASVPLVVLAAEGSSLVGSWVAVSGQ
jgi:hypothetical protein